MELCNDFSWRCIRLPDDSWIYAISKDLCHNREDVPLYLVCQDFVPEEYISSMQVKDGWVLLLCDDLQNIFHFEVYDNPVSGSIPVWLVNKQWK